MSGAVRRSGRRSRGTCVVDQGKACREIVERLHQRRSSVHDHTNSVAARLDEWVRWSA